MKRVMVPQNLLVWAVVDTDTGEVTDLWASDIEDNYWDDKHVKNGTLYYLEDWDDDVSDPVEPTLATKAYAQLMNTHPWPKLRIEESSR